MKFRTLLTILFCLLFTTSVHAETEYMCGNIPFVPNKPPKESCGWRCGPAKATTNYLVISPEDYAKYSYQKAKNILLWKLRPYTLSSLYNKKIHR